jgi:shikimate kinase
VLCEQKLDKTATEVFAEEGEPAWRTQETETLRGVRRHSFMTQRDDPAVHAY